MPGICRKCGEAVTNGFHCGCGVNTAAVEAFISKGDKGRGTATPNTEADVSGPSSGDERVAVGREVGTPIPSPASQGNQAGDEITTIENQLADLKAEVKRIEGEIDALFKQRKSTSSLEWYFFAIDHFNGANDPDAASSFRGPSLHISAWALFGFVWIPISYALWLGGNSERASWDLVTVRAMNRKVNDQIKAHRNRRTSLLDKLNALKTRLKELAGKNYSPDWKDDPSGAATVAIGSAVSQTTAKGRGLLKGLIKTIPVGRCPKCQENWAKEDDGENPLTTNFIPGQTVERGKGIEREVVSVTKVQHYEEKLRCKKCSHQWRIPRVRRVTLKEACPKCFREQSRRFARTEELGHADRITTVEREAGHYDKDHRFLGTTIQAVQVTERTVHQRHVYKCTGCNHEWSEKSSRSFIP